MLKDNSYPFSKVYINDGNIFTKILNILFWWETIGAFSSLISICPCFSKFQICFFQIYKINNEGNNFKNRRN